MGDLGKIRWIVVVAVAALLVTSGQAPPSAEARSSGSTPVVARGGYAPGPSALFGRPGDNGIRKAILRAINNTPRNAVIRGVTWSFSDMRIAKALNAAQNRGVHVYLLVGRNSWNYEAVRYLRNYLGGDSFIKGSRGPARKARDNPGGSMHQKSWTFSTTGTKKRVSIITSANVTDNANKTQYNDGYRFVGYYAVYNRIKDIFDQQVRFRTWPAPFREFNISSFTALTFGPWNTPGMADPVVRRINALPPRGLIIRVANAAFYGARGDGVARALAAKKRAGATVKVIHGKPFGANTRAILTSAKIPLQSAYWSENRYLHGKFMTARWRADGRVRYRVWTGSENWGAGSSPSDELVAKVGSAKAHEQFKNWFNYLWRL